MTFHTRPRRTGAAMKGLLLKSVDSDPELVDVPAPVAPDGLTVVRVRAAGVNPVDQKMAADASLPVPRVVGNEAVVEFDGRRMYAERTVIPTAPWPSERSSTPAWSCRCPMASTTNTRSPSGSPDLPHGC